MSDYIVLTIEFEKFNNPSSYKVTVQDEVTIEDLINDIRQEFAFEFKRDYPEDDIGTFILRRTRGRDSLTQNYTLKDLGITSGTKLRFCAPLKPEIIFIYIGETWKNESAQSLGAQINAKFIDLQSNRDLRISHTLSIIGREDTNVKYDQFPRLIVPNSPLSENENPIVSRDHALILYKNDLYYIMPLGNNKVSFNSGNNFLSPGKAYAIQHDDQLYLGVGETRVILKFDCP